MSITLLHTCTCFQASSTAWFTLPRHRRTVLLVALAISSVLSCLVPSRAVAGRVLQVGNGKTYTLPSQAAAAALDGDTIEIDAGIYAKDAATWKANSLTIRGVGGRAYMKSQGVFDSQGKAIWLIQGNNTTVENIEFSGAQVPDGNGAGIKLEGVSLTVRNCFFHDNQMGLLTGNQGTSPTSDIVVESSEFARNGANDGQTHNIYIGHVRTFTLRYSFSHDANNGQLVKSRANTNYVLYNRLVDQPGGTSNYELDLPNGGVNYVIGNIIYQSVNSENYTMLTHAAEGATNPGQELYVINNTFVNSIVGTGTFVKVVSPVTTLKVINNLFVGDGRVLWEAGVAKGVPENNLQTKTPGFLDLTNQNYRLVAGSPAIDKGVNPGTAAGGFALLPTFQYLDPLDKQSRPTVGSALDYGACEFGINPPSGTTTLNPPQNLTGSTTPSSIDLSWGPASSASTVINGYKVFRDGSLQTTVTGLTFADTTVSPTTAYTYYVKAIDSANHESTASNAVTLATPRLVTASVPTTAGWSQLTNTKIRPLCPAHVPGNTGCSAVVDATSGGAFDTKRNRLVIWGGGPDSYLGNELYALDLETLSVSRLTDPATPYTSGVEALAGGTQPNGRHTFDGLAYMENVDRLFSFGGGGHLSSTSNGSLETWTFDFATNHWQWMHPRGPNPKGFISMTAYDASTGKVFVHDALCMYSYDFATNSYQSLPVGGSCQRLNGVGYWMTGVLDPVRRKFFLFGGGDQWVIDVGPDSTFVPQAFKTTGAEALVSSHNPGLAYDPVNGRIVGWNGGDTVYVLNVDSKSWAAALYPGGPGSASPTGTLKRWNYAPKLGVFVVLNSVDRDAFVLRLSTNPVPAAPLGLIVQ